MKNIYKFLLIYYNKYVTRIYSPLAQWWSDRLLTGRLKVRVLQGEPFKLSQCESFFMP